MQKSSENLHLTSFSGRYHWNAHQTLERKLLEAHSSHHYGLVKPFVLLSYPALSVLPFHLSHLPINILTTAAETAQKKCHQVSAAVLQLRRY